MTSRRVLTTLAALLLFSFSAYGQDVRPTKSPDAGPPFKPTAKQTRLGVEPLGAVRASLDGQPHEWYVWRRHGRSQNEFESSMGGTAVTIFADELPTPVPGRSGLLISFTTAGTGPASTVDVTYVDTNMAHFNYSSNNSGTAKVSIDSMEKTRGLLHLVGSFSARMPFRVMSQREAMMSNVKTIEDGTFDVYVPPAE